MTKNINYYNNITNILEWVDNETMEGIYDGIYYKFIVSGYASERGYVELYGQYSDNKEWPGESVPLGVRWPTKKEVYDYVLNGRFEKKELLNKFPKFIFSGYIVERDYEFETEEFIMDEFKPLITVDISNNNWLIVLQPALNYVLSNEKFVENYIRVMSEIIDSRKNYINTNISVSDIENIFKELKNDVSGVEVLLMKNVLDKVIHEPSIFNPYLLEKNNRNLSENGKKIIKLQTLRSIIYHLIELNFISIDNELLELIYLINAELSVEWGFANENFDVNWNYFKFWDIPGLNQPTMDNNDNYPYGHYSIILNDLFSPTIHNNCINFAKTHKLSI